METNLEKWHRWDFSQIWAANPSTFLPSLPVIDVLNFKPAEQNQIKSFKDIDKSYEHYDLIMLLTE